MEIRSVWVYVSRSSADISLPAEKKQGFLAAAPVKLTAPGKQSLHSITSPAMDVNLQYYKSRATLLDYLARRGYDTAELTQFSKNEIEAMVKNETMDFIVSTAGPPPSKVYVKYMPLKQALTTTFVGNIVEDLYDNPDPDTDFRMDPEKDAVLVISRENPNDKMRAYAASLFETRGIYVSLFWINTLQYNVLDHVLQPQVAAILTPEELEALKQEYNFRDAKTQLPEISRFDPLAMCIFLRPGQVVKLLRNSPTAITAPYYRHCVG